MSTNNRAEALSLLITKAGKQGYLTVDEIIDCVDSLDLPIQDVDWITTTLTTRSVLIYDTVPTKTNIEKDEDEEYKDYAQSDYEALYEDVIRISPSLEPLINQIRVIVPPQYKEISRLKYQVLEGNKHARQRMIEMHLRQAIRIAYQRAVAFDIDLEEAVSIANAALVVAVDQYNPDENGTFGGFAAYRILRFMEREQPTKRPLFYYPVHKQTSYISSYQMLKQYGCVDCPEKSKCAKPRTMIAKNSQNCSENDIDDVIDQLTPIESIDEAVEAIQEFNYQMYGSEISYDDAVDMVFYPNPSEDEDMPFEIAAESQLKELINEALSTIPPREERVLRLRCGLGVKEALTLEEVGNLLEVTRERVRQIEAKAIRRLRNPKRARHLKGYVDCTYYNKKTEQENTTKEKREKKHKKVGTKNRRHSADIFLS